MNCVLYARVSTEKQADKELSIPAQLQAMRDYARQRGWMIAEEFVEPGASARTTERPALQRLLAAVRARESRTDVVVVHKIDRLARNVFDHATIRALLKQRGVKLASVVENVDDSITGQLVENIMASIAEFYSANLGEEAKKGMRMLVQKGGWPHRPPFGYQVVRDQSGKGRIVVNPERSMPLHKAFEHYASGSWSLNRLRLQLASEGVTTGKGKPLSHEMVRQILMNPFYAGRLRWLGAEYPGNHEPLVSERLFARVQRVLQLRQRDCGEKGKHHFRLRGFAFCSECDGKLTAEHHPRGSYYRCIQNTIPSRPCRVPYSNVNLAHEEMLRLIRRLQVTADLRDQILAAADRLISDRSATAKRELRSLQMQKTKLESREMHLTEAFAADQVSVSAYRSVVAGLRRRIESVVRSIREAEVDPAAVRVKVRDVLGLAASVSDLYETLNESKRSVLLRLLFKRVVLERGMIVAYELHPPFDRLLSESNLNGRGGLGNRLFENNQVTPAITAILEHDLSPILALSEELKAA